MEILTYRMKKEGHPNIIIAVVRDGKSQVISFSRCSRLDNFNRKIGRAIAVGRAEAVIKTNIVKPGLVGKIVAVPFPYHGDVTFQAGFLKFKVPQWLLTPKQSKQG